MNELKNVMVVGVAGNFAGHLKQAGEEADFAQHAQGDINVPQAVFPIYVPNKTDTFIGHFPLSHDETRLPAEIQNLQIEPEMAMLCDVTYDNGQVVGLTPVKFGAFNDCSIRRPNANKISEKKNWGDASKGLANQLIDIERFARGEAIDRFHIASFHKRGDELHTYGEDSPVSEYTYFYDTLLDWVMDRLNNQEDVGPKENISALIKQAGYPAQILMAVGATRYTPYGETHFLERGDTSMVVVYDSALYTPEQIRTFAEADNLKQAGMSSTIQLVK
uniref:DUF5718 family protein n=1 Tax=Thaumasiovibrio occultus TaxID=1891184 RepID=UPI000B362237|nr:DUF5718 family protein [Thaumasiovibrio occultus]